MDNKDNKNTRKDVETALLDPSRVFNNPNDILIRNDISASNKIKILRRWEYDIREMEVAEEENMGSPGTNGNGKIYLDQILEALHAIDNNLKIDHNSPTKHGGE